MRDPVRVNVTLCITCCRVTVPLRFTGIRKLHICPGMSPTLAMVSSPSSPNALLPQQKRVPSARSALVEAIPAETAVTLLPVIKIFVNIYRGIRGCLFLSFQLQHHNYPCNVRWMTAHQQDSLHARICLHPGLPAYCDSKDESNSCTSSLAINTLDTWWEVNQL
jgi:hypothetical protein